MELIKIFYDDNPNHLENEVERWTKVQGDSIEIIARQYSTCAQTSSGEFGDNAVLVTCFSYCITYRLTLQGHLNARRK